MRMLLVVRPLGVHKVTIRPARPHDLARFEARYAMRLTGDLRQWLLTCNGAEVNPGGIYGVRPTRMPISAESILHQEPTWKMKGWFPLANDGCGDYYVVATKSVIQSTQTHPVMFVDQSDYAKPAYTVASGVWQFLWFLLQDQLLHETGSKGYWPFDQKKVLEVDPALSKCSDGPLPWDA